MFPGWKWGGFRPKESLPAHGHLHHIHTLAPEGHLVEERVWTFENHPSFSEPGTQAKISCAFLEVTFENTEVRTFAMA